jgi:hypothetical protein
LPNDDKIYLMKKELELELLLSFDGASYQASEGYVVEFTVRRTDITAERPHGISYALVSGRRMASPSFDSTTLTRPIVLAGNM